MSDFETSVKSIPAAAESSDLVLVHLKFSFLIGLGLFIILFPFYSSRKSLFDALAARNVIRITRLFIILEFACVITLFYYYFTLGSPITLHAQLAYGNGDSWLYGYGQPTCSLIFICLLGVACDMHPFLRLLTMAGCGVEIMSAALSAYQVRDYYRQIRGLAAPSFGYSAENLLTYYWRDVISLGLCTTILFLVAFLTCIVGWWPPQLIHPAQISGYDLDRFQVMRTQRTRRRTMEQRGFLGEIPQPRRAKPTISQMLQAVPVPDEEEKSDEEEGERDALMGRDDRDGEVLL